MGEICLSVAPNLRCQSLTRIEAGILLVPPGLEIIFAIVLLWTKRGADKKHVFIAAEVFIYFLLAVIDVFTHTLPTIGTSLDSFKALDIIIGVASFIPLFLYTFSLYLLTTAELIPSLPVRFQNITKYALLAFIPLIVVLNELGSFIGITYRQFGGGSSPIELGVGFSNTTAEMFISSVTLVLLTAFQATNFCIAFYRLVRALSHQRTLDASQQEKEMEAHLFRGLGWIVAGMKLGAIETVIGFAQGGFGIALTRRILRLLSHACLIIGIVKGVDTIEDFQLYSPSEVRKRRKSTLRAMIQNPRFSTFRHVGGHDFEKNPFDERRQSVIRLGSPSWMRRDFVKPTPIVEEEEERYTPGLLSARKSTSLTFMLAPHPTLRPKPGSNRGSGSSFGSAKRTMGSDSDYVDVQKDFDEVDLSDLPTPIPRVGLPPRPARQRVTVHIRQDRLPILELHRLSNLSFSDFMRDPFRDQHARARSLPDARERTDEVFASHTVSASFTRLPMYAGAPAPTPATPQPVLQVPMRQSTTSRYSRTASFASYDRPWSGLSAGNARQSSMPSFNVNQHLSYATTAGPTPRESSMASFTQRLSTASTDFDPRASRASRSYSGSQLPTAMSFYAIGSPTNTIMELERSRSPTPPANRLRINPSPDRRDRGVSSSTTASEVNAIALQFPGIPPRHFSQTTRRSVLSHEISRAEFVVDPDEPMPAPPRASESPSSPATVTESERTVSRTSSGKRKSPPAPLQTKGLTDARVVNVEIEQDVDDKAVAAASAAAMSSLPTPLSAPRYASMRARSHSASRVADVPVTAVSDDDHGSFDSGFREVPVVRSASLVRRGSEQERRGKLVRVKSVGQVPIHSVSASAREQSMVRDSVVVELGMIAREGEVEMRYDPVAV
ncbi:hypothetical protein GSI_09021 [Ganoderma sinense ZZ0214-1]|uniref:Uncharacterized protein n=1 Tax=Ganoderma sinense ZZ0214-1 TaxID=1077348 RepID=A0A2G8S5G8_9APHY|nr:hypothetical protein GSI_09021 [Ganoderma sinense ZZ0214-1]